MNDLQKKRLAYGTLIIAIIVIILLLLRKRTTVIPGEIAVPTLTMPEFPAPNFTVNNPTYVVTPQIAAPTYYSSEIIIPPAEPGAHDCMCKTGCDCEGYATDFAFSVQKQAEEAISSQGKWVAEYIESVHRAFVSLNDVVNNPKAYLVGF